MPLLRALLLGDAAVALGEDVVLVLGQQSELLRLLGCRAAHERVQHVVVLLLVRRPHDARALEEVGADVGAHLAHAVRVAQLQELAEAARVVVAHRLCVAKGFEDRRALQHAVGERPGTRARRARAHGVNLGQVLHADLGRLGLPRARLAGHEDRLRAGAAVLQPREGRVRHRVDVRRLGDEGVGAAVVAIDDALLVNRQPAERVDAHTDLAAQCVGQPRPEALLQVADHGLLVQSGQVDHVRRAGIDAEQMVCRQRRSLRRHRWARPRPPACARRAGKTRDQFLCCSRE